ncbi:MAG: hypothetical protein AAFR42_20685, partial [Cyanobacteria bacterium J06628_6]
MFIPINPKPVIAYAKIPALHSLTPFSDELNFTFHALSTSLPNGPFHLMPIVKNESPHNQAEKSRYA